MEQGAEKILAKHGCLYMKDDYKALFEELEAYYKPTEVVKNNAVLPFVMPRNLTAENGAKGLLSGEFVEYYEAYDEEEGEYTVEIPVSWTTIKDIYKKIVAYYGA